MQRGKIGVTTDNIFPIIKKFLYSEHEIFLRELVSNAVDATSKLRALSNAGEYTQELGDTTIRVAVDKDKKTITVTDKGIGMTADEVEKYINQIAFSSAGEFLDKYKDKIDAIIGHFGLGFYSSFMVSERVEIFTKSYRAGSQAVRWECDGSPEYTIEECDKQDVGTEIVLHVDENSAEFLEESKIEGMLKKYCKFLPVTIAFGKEKEWKDGKQIDTDKDKVINNTKPAWTKKPADLTDEDYKNFYRELYPAIYDEPLFNIHLNVDYPFNLTGILYFPRIKNNLEINKNKIQLYCNQVFVSDSVEGIVPDYLTLLHGVLDSPDIPLNVSRSYLQSDSNVKKISGHITKKVADRLNDIFKNDRPEFEKKWDDLKLFIQYGMITDEKFYERAEKFFLFKNTNGKYFTMEEYETLIKENQTDKDKKLVYLYASNVEQQYSFIEAAKSKGYDVLIMDGYLDAHFINNVESKLKSSQFVRVDAEVADKLIKKEEERSSKLSADQQDDLRQVFKSQLSDKDNYWVTFEPMGETDNPAVITQSEFMRRMKDMSHLGGGASFYGSLPDNYSFVINSNHPLVVEIAEEVKTKTDDKLAGLKAELKRYEVQVSKLDKEKSGKKDEEIPQADKDLHEELSNKIEELKKEKESVLNNFANQKPLVKQLIDLALLANNMLKGEALVKFVKRSVELIKVNG